MKRPFSLLPLLFLWYPPLNADPPSARSQPSATRTTGIYSNLRYIAEAGDLVGFEIFIIPGDVQHWALLQVAEGAPSKPELVPVVVNADNVEFPFPQFGKDAAFKGKVTASGLEGTISKTTPPVRLRLARGRSYWQQK